jgi:hypothetical protein
VPQAFECEAVRFLLQPLLACPRSDTTISDLVRGSAAYAELLESEALEDAMVETSRALFSVFASFLALVGSHRILHAYRWWASFSAVTTATSNPTGAQVDRLVRALLMFFQDLDAVGEMFPPSELARAFVAEGAFSLSPVTRIDIVSAISEQVRREMAVYDLQSNIYTRVL